MFIFVFFFFFGKLFSFFKNVAPEVQNAESKMGLCILIISYSIQLACIWLLALC